MSNEWPRIAPGLKGTASLRVGTEHSAATFGSGDVPVFATPMLVALMERAAVEALGSALDAGKTTVGTWIEVSHVAATPLGMDVRAEANLTAVDGRTLTFHIVAHDAVEQIGEAHHRRVIVDSDGFVARVGKKAAGGGR
jgi:fluoroacetyl-CoA thioesterase